jgi:Fe(3+) dicitrate transport protein
MRAVAGQGAVAGDESIDAHLVWDALASVRLSEAFSAYLKVDNLMDETYVASRRPAGLRPGLERSAYAGVIFGF